MQNVGRALKRREEEEVKGVQSAVRTQKYINIVFSKDVELAASFAGESSTLALTETENKKLERLDREREKKNNAGSQFKKPKIDKSYNLWPFCRRLGMRSYSATVCRTW